MHIYIFIYISTYTKVCVIFIYNVTHFCFCQVCLYLAYCSQSYFQTLYMKFKSLSKIAVIEITEM